MARTRKGLDRFSVMLAGKCIEVIYIVAAHNMTAEELRRSLVKHGGFDERVTVRCTSRAASCE